MLCILLVLVLAQTDAQLINNCVMNHTNVQNCSSVFHHAYAGAKDLCDEQPGTCNGLRWDQTVMQYELCNGDMFPSEGYWAYPRVCWIDARSETVTITNEIIQCVTISEANSNFLAAGTQSGFVQTWFRSKQKVG